MKYFPRDPYPEFEQVFLPQFLPQGQAWASADHCCLIIPPCDDKISYCYDSIIIISNWNLLSIIYGYYIIV